ncbi:DsbE family thiol:disulfide interchange protein [Mongoliimonas terrestris]|uniref:DsbE family thiol:disulfide interchange protein n=1 Tax=Mongoliimonas terrestris TaxID=1709001 RepID=UPI00094987BC|nr:DsbE family thiol:disulfide interchange protein [Mongoliimonas terrestris]
MSPPREPSPTAADNGTPPATPRRSIPIWAFLPVLLFAALATLFYVRLYAGDPSQLPSALIGQPVPAFTLPPVDGLTAGGEPVPGLAAADLSGGVTVVNVWASWCGPCRAEHPLLMDLAADDRFRLVGLNYKDSPANATRFLNALGNPFSAVGADQSGRVGIDWGVYGVPETFVVGADGTIAYKHVGPLDPDSLANRLMPAIDAALAAARPAS